MAAAQQTDWKKEIPHIIVFIILILVLLVILTKFKWIHCSQVPLIPWCSWYCEMFGKSRVGIVYGGEGMGNPVDLQNEIINFRYYTVVDPPLPLSTISIGVLKNYELVILENAKKITRGQANALKMYLEQGGNMLWIGDSGTQYYATDEDLAQARIRNNSEPGYYEAFVRSLNKTSGGFGELADYLFVKYVETKPAQPGMTFNKVNADHLIMSGINESFPLPAVPFTVVTVNQAGTNLLATIKVGDKEYPAIIDTRYVGRIVYVSFPIEQVPALAQGRGKYLLTNILDYLVTC
jgi:hypothetical protein